MSTPFFEHPILNYGGWAFAEFTEVFQIQANLKATMDTNFNPLIKGLAAP